MFGYPFEIRGHGPAISMPAVLQEAVQKVLEGYKERTLPPETLEQIDKEVLVLAVNVIREGRYTDEFRKQVTDRVTERASDPAFWEKVQDKLDEELASAATHQVHNRMHLELRGLMDEHLTVLAKEAIDRAAKNRAAADRKKAKAANK